MRIWTALIFVFGFPLSAASQEAGDLELAFTLEPDSPGEVWAMEISPDKKWLVSGGKDTKVRVWDLNLRKVLQTFEPHQGLIHSVTISPDGKTVVSSGREPGTCRWDVGSGKLMKKVIFSDTWVTDGINEGPRPWHSNAARISPDGKVLALPLIQHIAICNPQTLAEQGARIAGHQPGKQDPTVPLGGVFNLGVDAAAFSPDSARLVSGGSDRVARIWDVKTRKELAVLKGHTELICAVSFSPDGNRVATASRDGTVRTWEAKTGKQLRSWTLGIAAWYSVSFGASGRWLVAANNLSAVKLWNSESGEEVAASGKLQGVRFAFSADGTLLAGGDDSGTIRIWKAPGVATTEKK
jgi:WD40 repeat protein